MHVSLLHLQLLRKGKANKLHAAIKHLFSNDESARRTVRRCWSGPYLVVWFDFVCMYYIVKYCGACFEVCSFAHSNSGISIPCIGYALHKSELLIMSVQLAKLYYASVEETDAAIGHILNTVCRPCEDRSLLVQLGRIGQGCDISECRGRDSRV